MVAERAARLTTKKWCSADAPGFATLPLGYNAETSPFFARWYAKKAWRLLYSDLLTRILAGSPYPARVSHPSVPSVQRSAGLEDSAAGKQVAHGVLNCDGSIDTPSCGTPQGGVISPILANIYLHFVLDRWFDGDVKKNSNGEAHMVRYADDFTAAFRYHRNAARFLRRLPSRLGKFSLKLAPDKTRKLMFNRFRKSEIGVFSFLGFEFRWISTRKGIDTVKLRTDSKRMRRIVGEFKEWCKKCRHKRIAWIMGMVKTKLRGIRNYYGVVGNSAFLRNLNLLFRKTLYRWLNRRSERRSFNWNAFSRIWTMYNVSSLRRLDNEGYQLSFLPFLR